VDEEQSVQVEVPLDEDGFLRRACGSCEREFKWFPSEQSDGEPEPTGGYYCPYCRRQGEDWLTSAQREWVIAQGTNEVLGPMMEEMDQSLRKSSEGMIEARLEWEPAKASKPIEPNDMVRVDFSCHPNEPIKVLDGWSAPVHCLVCGQPAERE
jgi:hypothetical protein